MTINDILELARERKWNVFLTAYGLACEAHRNDTRDGGEPYISHVENVIIGTFKLVSTFPGITDIQLEEVLILAALHDAYEDHPEEYSLEIIASVLRSADADSKFNIDLIIDGIDRLSKKKKGTELYSFYVARINESIATIIVKLADIYDNSKNLKINSNRFDKYELTVWTLFVSLSYDFKQHIAEVIRSDEFLGGIYKQTSI